MTRVVSLVPSITETLLEWGVVPVGVTRFCEAPGIPTVGGTKNPDLDAIVSLRPDVVLMDEEENRAPDAAALTGAGVRVVATAVRSVDDVAAALAALAEAGVTSPQAAVVPAPPQAGPAVPIPPVRAFVPIWRRPWMTVGGRTYGSSLLSAAGFANVFSSEPDPYPQVEPAEAAARSPDVVLAPSEPYPFGERHRQELEQVAPVVFVDGRDVFWWGTRTPGALERLTGMARGLARA